MNLTDPFNRRLSYLRLSVTDLCNYRCNYCLPNGYPGKAKPDELTLPEIETLAAVFARNGTRKIRITGGEPTLRRDLPDIIAACRAQPEIQHIALTTNAFRLGKLFPQYRAAGLDKLNVSIDSFNPETFFKITGKQECRHILNDLENILAEGFNNVKINTLLLREHIAETLPDAIDFAFKQQFHRIGGDVAREHARAARNQDNVDFRIGNGNGNARTDVVQLVTHQIARMDDVFAVLHRLRQIIAAAVFFGAAGVGNGQDVNIEWAECGRWFFERIVFGHG